ELPFDPNAIKGEPQSLFQTGGTTGDPKLVHHGHHFFQAVQDLSRIYLETGQPHIRHLLVSGTWHVSSQMAAMMTLYTGGTLFLHDGLEFDKFMETVERERITSSLMAPPLLYGLLDDPQLAKADMSSLLSLTVAGSNATTDRVGEAVDR